MITTVQASMQPRYWEDAVVNGNAEDDNNPTIPGRNRDTWNIEIDVESGKIANWPQGTTAKTHYKVCDAGFYSFYDESDFLTLSFEGYVPPFLYPNADGWGDYVILDIDADGKINHWDPKAVDNYLEYRTDEC